MRPIAVAVSAYPERAKCWDPNKVNLACDLQQGVMLFYQ